jgi:hypothetical protein
MDPMRDEPIQEPQEPTPNEARRATQAVASGFVLGLFLALAARRRSRAS